MPLWALLHFLLFSPDAHLPCSPASKASLAKELCVHDSFLRGVGGDLNLNRVVLEPIPRKQLTVERLAQAIFQALTDERMRNSAANLGLKIQGENGVASAVAVIQEITHILLTSE
jgi:hypothetical protein